MPRRPPTSTLFPYTTLFRSERVATADPVQLGTHRVGVVHPVELDELVEDPRLALLDALDVFQDRVVCLAGGLVPPELELALGRHRNLERCRLVSPAMRGLLVVIVFVLVVLLARLLRAGAVEQARDNAARVGVGIVER